MTYGYFTADISTDAAYARPTDRRKSALRAFTGENFPSASAHYFSMYFFIRTLACKFRRNLNDRSIDDLRLFYG